MILFKNLLHKALKIVGLFLVKLHQKNMFAAPWRGRADQEDWRNCKEVSLIIDKGIYGYANTFIQIYEYNIGKAWKLRKCRFCLVLGQGNLLNNENYSDSTVQDGESCRTGRCSTCSRCSTRSTSVRRRWIHNDVRSFNKVVHNMAFLFNILGIWLLPNCILILAKFMFSKVVFLPCFYNSCELF